MLKISEKQRNIPIYGKEDVAKIERDLNMYTGMPRSPLSVSLNVLR